MVLVVGGAVVVVVFVVVVDVVLFVVVVAPPPAVAIMFLTARSNLPFAALNKLATGIRAEVWERAICL